MSIAVQDTFEDLGDPLSQVTFVVVDLETTGTTPGTAEITEIGAVKVRGGEVLGEFQTLVRTQHAIPPMITALTGITTTMVQGAPTLPGVLCSFLEFAQGAVLVAHNAPFDIGFLRAAAAQCDIVWPNPMVLDTVKLARRVVTRDEAPNHKLATLAAVFGATVTPNHRALSDARATVDVLHGLLGRLGNLGITHQADLPHAADDVPESRRRKRHLADGLPTGPGVYQFLDDRDTVLYVGVATSIRSRVRSYFTTAERRGRMDEMVSIATRVRAIATATVLEAQVREVRLIAELKPPYNRRDRFPARAQWARLQLEPHPRLTLVRSPAADDAAYFGPFTSRASGELALRALREAVGWYDHLPGGDDEVPRAAAAAREAIEHDIGPVVEALEAKMAALAAEQRYEDAAACRDRLVALLQGLRRSERMAALSAIPSLTATRYSETGWQLVEVRYGRLAGSTVARPGSSLPIEAEALRALAEVVEAGVPPQPRATASEARLVADWLAQEGTHVLHAEGCWAEPARGAGRYGRLLVAAGDAGAEFTA